MKHILEQIGIVLIATLLSTGVAQSSESNNEQEVIWFSTDTSNLLNRSTIALAGEHINRGIRLAYQALHETLNLTDQVIANHNLCIGYLSNDEAEFAASFCARTFELSQNVFHLSRVRGAYRLSEVHSDSDMSLTLAQVVISNIRQKNPQSLLSHRMK